MNKKKSSKKNSVLLVVIVGIFIIGGYFAISKGIGRPKKNTDILQAEITKLLEKDIESSYPATPREVVKLYSRYTKCVYNGALSDDDIMKMAEQVFLMYDEELILNNPLDEYVYDLKLDIAEYVSSERTITSYSVDTANNVVTWSEGDTEYARLMASYTTREDGAYNKTFEEFLLRKDSAGRWKIVGFRSADTDELN